ncbi:MAG: HYR domain-containing protein [Pyrinomonadaceae bacterium]
MKTKRTATIAITDRARSRVRALTSYLCFSVLFSILVASLFHTGSSASSNNKPANPASSAIVATKSVTGAPSRSMFTRWLAPLAPLGPDTVATYQVMAGACTNNLQDSFNLGDDVCVKASADLEGRRLSVAGTDGTVASLVDVTTDPQELIFTLPSTTTSIVNGLVVDNRGIWRATVHSSADFGGRATAFFSVTDPANAASDLVIFNDSTATDDTVAPGDPTGFLVYLRNEGPDAAAAVHVTQNVPANMTFDSATPGSGTAFTCSESGGVVDCAPAGNLASGAISSFTLNYTVSGGAPNAILTTEIDIASTITDPHPTSNISLSRLEIRTPGSSSPTCALACPLNRTVGANTTQAGQPGAFVTFAADIEATGDCGAVTSSPASGSFFAVAGSPHTVMVSSATGGGSCSFTITVTQTAAPTITCMADQNATTSGSSNEASVTVNPPSFTGTNAVLTGVRNDNRSLSDSYPVGTTTITWTATECNNPPACDDPNARSASCTQRIIVTSPDAPTISCPSNKTFAATDCSGRTLSAADIGTATGTGSNIIITSLRSDGLNLTSDPYPVGTTTIIWSATDDGGRLASCTQTITITSSGADSVPPTLNVPPNVSATTSSCSALLDDELGVATASDNCGTVTITRSGVPTFACPTPSDPGKRCESFVFPTGTTIVTYTATDNAGNVTTGTQSVTVTESPAVNPTITAPADVSVNTGPGATSCGTVVSDATLGNASANDNCPGVAVSRTGVPAGNNFPVGTTNVIYTATDASGNTASATQRVMVVDNTAPVVTAPGAITLYTGPGATSCGVTVSNLNATLGTGSATDNCPGVGAVTRSGVPAGNFFPVGQTTLTYSATDANGNTSSANQLVTVVDNTLPQISCPADIIADFDPAVNGAVVTYTAPVGTDNCASTTTQIAGLASGATFPVGTTTNTFRVTDASGNTAQCSFKVTVAITSIIGLDSASLTGNALVDSYDSTIGYPASKGSLANLLSNGLITISGSSKMFGNVRSTRAGVSLLGTSQINGNATAGTTVSKGASTIITGTITNNALAPVMTLPSVPACSPFSSNSGISGTYTYNASTGDLTLSGINVATLANGTYCFHNISLSNSGQLKVNGPVVIKLTGTLTTSGATSLPNTTLIPSNLQILSSYSGTNGVALGNSSSLQLVIYAPQTNVNITGSAPLFGTVVGKTVTVSNSGMIHYDTKLKTIWPGVWALIFGP